jgi:hypothetical protein
MSGTTQLTLSVDPYGLEEELYGPGKSGHGNQAVGGQHAMKRCRRAVMEAFPLGSKSVVLASGENWPDALAASSLAGVMKCPVIFTEQKEAFLTGVHAA